VVDALEFAETVPCVVKVAKRSASPAENSAEWAVLRNEASVLKELAKRHASSAQTLPCTCCYFVDRHMHYLVVEDCGVDLLTLLAWGNARWHIAAHLVGVVSAVEWLHERNIVHGNIRPENFLCKAVSWWEITVKLGDFTRSCTPGDLCEAPQDLKFSAPENATGAVASLSMDVFSLGLVLWQLLHNTARPALETDDAAALALLRTKQPALNKILLWPRCWNFMELVVLIEPQSRPKSSDVLQRLREVLMDPQFIPIFDACMQKATAGRTINLLAAVSPAFNPAVGEDATEEENPTPFGSPTLDCDQSSPLASRHATETEAWVPENREKEETRKNIVPSCQSTPTRLPVETVVKSAIMVLRAAQQELIFSSPFPQLDMFSPLIPAYRTGVVDDGGEYLRDVVKVLRIWRFCSPTYDSLLGALARNVRTQCCEPSEDALGESGIAVSTALRRLDQELRRLFDDARCLRKLRVHTGVALASDPGLRNCLLSLMRKRDCPQLPVLLPCVPDDWDGLPLPLRLQKNRFRLFFLCSHSKLPIPCGFDGAGHYITADVPSVHKVMPAVRISLWILTSVLKRPECDALPTVFFGAKLNTKQLQLQYLNAVLDLMAKPVSVAECTYILDAVPESGAVSHSAAKTLMSRANEAYAELLVLLRRHDLLRDKCTEWGMRQVGPLWIADADSAEIQVLRST
jgi:serine/threonine protein kinase